MTPSANKRQNTVIMNQILMQKWFSLQNIKDSSWDRNWTSFVKNFLI
jgi:hypothetical protein